ncbi:MULTISPECIES: NAD(P)-dependent oxidoreductase [unclassified Streptomyces]|uniref:NAD(P)-dependent oxidoreductase n=1 Tax=unclassified Streptomyces TaxID=2593676 RepID=UPI00225266F4|nr:MULTISPECIES: NAD(P)-dependent oxidoreductase [unclassified Streptomyces]MCX4402716.1 hypothetical protein [Streptomyces sp. NBC_01764]MCX5182312.1 hypothetical protein [Streptomyces sp. NBC_00268]
MGPVLGARVTFVTDPSPDDLAVAEGVFAMAPRVTKGPRPLTDPEATLAVLESGRSSGVGPDVSHPEPARHHPLFDHPDVVLTPHLMGMTRRATTLTFADAARGVAGRPPAAVANPEWNHRKATA